MTNLRARKALLALAMSAVIVTSATVGTAVAAPSKSATTGTISVTSTAATAAAGSTTPVKASAGGPTDVQIWPGQEGQTVVITVVEIDATTKLPATVRIPVMPGTSVQWVGEVLGGDAASDIAQPYKLVQGEGGQFAEFTLTKSHRGQVDAIGFPVKVSGDVVSVGVDWVQSVSSAITALSVRVPAGASKIEISPKPSGSPVTNDAGESLYSLNPKNFKPGEKEHITVSYSTAPVAPKAAGSELTPVLIGLGIALVVAVVALFAVISRNNTAAPGGGDGTDDADGPRASAPKEPERRAADDDEDDDEPFLDFD